MEYTEIRDTNALLSKYSGDYTTLKNIIDTLDDRVINHVPDIEGAWSIKEHLGHLVDTEVNGYLRFMKAILNPGTTIDVGKGDIDNSNTILDYASRDVNDMLEFFRLIRKLISEHAGRLKDGDFDSCYIEHINHPIFKKCTVRFILSFHTQHFDKHIEFLKRNIKMYNESAGKD